MNAAGDPPLNFISIDITWGNILLRLWWYRDGAIFRLCAIVYILLSFFYLQWLPTAHTSVGLPLETYTLIYNLLLFTISPTRTSPAFILTSTQYLVADACLSSSPNLPPQPEHLFARQQKGGRNVRKQRGERSVSPRKKSNPNEAALSVNEVRSGSREHKRLQLPPLQPLRPPSTLPITLQVEAAEVNGDKGKTARKTH